MTRRLAAFVVDRPAAIIDGERRGISDAFTVRALGTTT
jgi:hypothetical protein